METKNKLISNIKSYDSMDKSKLSQEKKDELQQKNNQNKVKLTEIYITLS
jgi:hypothetical protein